MRHSSFSSKVLHNRPHYNSDCSPVPRDLRMLKYFHFSANSVSHILEHPRCELGQSRSERYSSHLAFCPVIPSFSSALPVSTPLTYFFHNRQDSKAYIRQYRFPAQFAYDSIPFLAGKVVFSYKVFQHNSNSVHIYQIQFLCHTITSQGHCSITFRVVKDKLNLNHSRRHITRIFPRCPILVVVNITASSLLKLHIQEFLQPDNSHIFAIRKKVIYRSAGPFQLSGWRRYLF